MKWPADFDPYVEWICARCAKVKGGKMPDGHVATFHEDRCDVCFCWTAVTQPTDYGLHHLGKPHNHPGNK